MRSLMKRCCFAFVWSLIFAFVLEPGKSWLVCLDCTITAILVFTIFRSGESAPGSTREELQDIVFPLIIGGLAAKGDGELRSFLVALCSSCTIACGLRGFRILSQRKL